MGLLPAINLVPHLVVGVQDLF